ncbi:hypothetical protein MKEN_00018700 [Mycena kentingensis (nom. inval.)]|nr:hypothetical protein MKEN_00018700 [Mycena kentingensis (nom. inval.)]
MDPLVRVIILASLWLVYTVALILIIYCVLWVARTIRRRMHTTSLLGPSTPDADGGDIAGWSAKYGPVFAVPRGWFERTVVLCDAAAIEHFYAQSPAVYRVTPATRRCTRNLVGKGLACVDGEQHTAYRQVLSPLFSTAAVAGYAPTFFTMANKVHSIWADALQSRPRGMVVEISHWMNSVVLDSLGAAGFAHDFNSLSGNYCPVTAAFYALRAPAAAGSLADKLFRAAPALPAWAAPLLRMWPGDRNRIMRHFRAVVHGVAGGVVERHSSRLRKPADGDGDGDGESSSGSEGQADCSYISLLIKSLAEDPAGERRLSQEEVATQNTWLFSGFETTAASLTWLLIELAKHPEVQERLRAEIRQVQDGAEDYSEIARLPYLHAVVYETLRLHPPMGGTTRVAGKDDIIPLSAPIATTTSSSFTRTTPNSDMAKTVNSIKIAKGTHVTVPIRPVNTRSEFGFWGPGAGMFDPERWWIQHQNVAGEGEGADSGGDVDGSGSRDREGKIMHLAFGDGGRACIGAGVALGLMKVVVFVLVRGYTFALPHGPRTRVEAVGEPVARPQARGDSGSEGEGTAVMMVVRKAV